MEMALFLFHIYIYLLDITFIPVSVILYGVLDTDRQACYGV